jgi:hypothetical protein
MPRLHVENDEDQEFAESILFSIAAADEFATVEGQHARSLSDVVHVCLRRNEQIRRRLLARGVDWLRRQGDIIVSWNFCLEDAVVALEHIEPELEQRDLNILNAGRSLLATLPVAILRWQFDEPFECQACEEAPMVHSSGIPLPPAETLEAIMADPRQGAVIDAARTIA